MMKKGTFQIVLAVLWCACAEPTSYSNQTTIDHGMETGAPIDTATGLVPSSDEDTATWGPDSGTEPAGGLSGGGHPVPVYSD